MADYNIIMHQLDSTDGETLHNVYPESKSGLIKFPDNKTLTTVRNDLESSINLNIKGAVSASEPTVGVTTNFVWIDLTSKTIKVRGASGTWISLGAVYL